MGPFDTLFHLLSFLAPAVAVACVVALAGPILLPRQSPVRAWWIQAGVNLAVGGLVLMAGLWYWGVDGKMATYMALAMAIATSQWACGRCWRG